MRIIRTVLAAVLALSLVAGYGGTQTKKTVLAAEAGKAVRIKAASDFTLKVPADWKGNYVMKGTKKTKVGSYVSFYSKKCYKKTKEGWLFTIMRYKDDSYQDMPAYDMVGKWGGYYYIALYPTDVQTMGAGKAAKRQYDKMNQSSVAVAKSICPAKKKQSMKGFCRAVDFALKLPSGWKGNYIVEKGKKKSDSYIVFYSKKCYNQSKQGWLFSVVRYKGDSYQDLPAYELVGRWNGYDYVAEYPTDVQYEGAPKAAQRQYVKLAKSVEKMARSIVPLV